MLDTIAVVLVLNSALSLIQYFLNDHTNKYVINCDCYKGELKSPLTS